MSSLNETPRSDRIRIAFFGLRNAGKSTLINEFTGREIAIVSDVPGTTTDPVSKAMEIHPLGPCQIIDTAGLDDSPEVSASVHCLAVNSVQIAIAGLVELELGG
jgi:small GTP-binding protein